MTTIFERTKHLRNFTSVVGSAVLILFLALGSWACESPDDQVEATPAQETGELKEFTFVGYMDGFVGVGGDIDGQTNPTLEVNAGDEVVIHLINGETMPHDLAFKSHDVGSDMLVRVDEETSFSFIAQSDDTYYCTVPGHEQAGMVGAMKVNGAESSPGQPRAQR